MLIILVGWKKDPDFWIVCNCHMAWRETELSFLEIYGVQKFKTFKVCGSFVSLITIASNQNKLRCNKIVTCVCHAAKNLFLLRELLWWALTETPQKDRIWISHPEICSVWETDGSEFYMGNYLKLLQTITFVLQINLFFQYTLDIHKISWIQKLFFG